ncbi:uncharacterized protein LOC143632953 [Bidens hawaiensis]|uniref:uncharacterized protein LOC143632953 n=1 Tax=Bidens hawaiensis TaxID=980011 RepID=UPI0040495AF5
MAVDMVAPLLHNNPFKARHSVRRLYRAYVGWEVLIKQLVDKYKYIVLVGDVTKYFRIALKRGFARGRKMEHVAVACFYLTCREMMKAILLIEFAYDLGVNVHKLAVMYIQLCELFGLQDHPVLQNPVDPTFFMHRYTSGLMKDDNKKEVWSTALHLAVCVKRDWIMTGRKPSGMCAAAIYVSSMFHGYGFSKTDVVEAVQICEATLPKRLIEFENTESGSITVSSIALLKTK